MTLPVALQILHSIVEATPLTGVQRDEARDATNTLKDFILSLNTTPRDDAPASPPQP